MLSSLIKEKIDHMMDSFIDLKKKRIRDRSDNVQQFEKINKDIEKVNYQLKNASSTISELIEEQKKITKVLNIQSVPLCPDEDERNSNSGEVHQLKPINIINTIESNTRPYASTSQKTFCMQTSTNEDKSCNENFNVRLSENFKTVDMGKTDIVKGRKKSRMTNNVNLSIYYSRNKENTNQRSDSLPHDLSTSSGITITRKDFHNIKEKISSIYTKKRRSITTMKSYKSHSRNKTDAQITPSNPFLNLQRDGSRF